MPLLASKSVYINRSNMCFMCVYVTVNIQFDNTSTSKYSICSPSAQMLWSLAPNQKFWIHP